MRLPTAIVAVTAMIALTFVQVPANATPPCDPATNTCCNIAPTFLYCAFDNHLLTDPTEIGFEQLGLPSAFAGCSAAEATLIKGGTSVTVPAPAPVGNRTVNVGWKNTPAYQVLAGMGGCLSLPASAQGKAYHANIAALGGAASAPGCGGLPGNLFFGCLGIDSGQVCFYTASFTVLKCDAGFTADTTDDGLTQLVGYQSVPVGAAWFDIEAPSGLVSVESAFWQDQ